MDGIEFNTNPQDENLFDELDNNDVEELTPTDESNSEEVEDNTEEEVEEQEDLFNEDVEESNTEEEVKPNIDERVAVLQYLTDKGIAESDDVDISNFSDDDMDVYISDKMESFFNKRMKETFEGLPDIVRQINEYAIAGGDVTAFFNQIASNNQINPNNINIEEPSHQEYIVATTLQRQGYPEDFIKSQLDFLKQSNNLETHAKTYYNQYQQAQIQEREALIKQQEEAERLKEEQTKNLQKRINQAVSQDVIGDYTLSMRDKKELSTYMTSPAYVLDNKETITEFQKDLFYEISKNETTMLQLALLLKNRNEDGSFNFSGIKSKAVTETTNKIRNNIRRVNQNVTPSTDKTPKYNKKSLADYF